MSLHYSAVVCSQAIRLTGMDEVRLPTGDFGYFADSSYPIMTEVDEIQPTIDEFGIFIYDDRVGYRESRIFRGRNQVTYGQSDELWVPVDEHGFPVRSANPLLFVELDDEIEYETIKDAIQLGLNDLGIRMTSQELAEFAT